MEKGYFNHIESISDKAAQLPMAPGIYLMKDKQGCVIYVGKAKSLKNRVRSYFHQGFIEKNDKTSLMISKIDDFDTIITQTEKEALILENTLIKKYRPRFNVIFRDDKDYPYLRLSIKDPYPNITIIRRPQRDRAVYFGPFASSQAVRDTLKIIHKIFPLRKCKNKYLKKPRPCIYYQLGQCLGPCFRNINNNEYLNMVKDVRLFLQGFGNRITKSLKARMEIESDSLNFEAAARIRDQLSAIEKTLERQAVVSLDFVDRDVFSFYREGSQMEVTSLFVRSGRMIGSKSFFLKNIQLSDEEALSSFISQYYHMDEFIPNEIVVPVVLDDRSLFQEWLRDKKGSNVRILNPKRGSKKNLLKLATQNAVVMFKKNSAYDEDRETILKELKSRLYLKNYPFHIECFDISNIMGTSAVGSMIVFEGGMPLKEGYRRYSIKSVHQPNDYAMMYEVLDRHLDRVKNSGSIPDLIIVDGGKGHLNVLLKALHDKGISNIDAIAMAKGKNAYNKTASIEKEKIFLPNRKNPVMFSKKDKAFFLLVRVRDEAHRFAVSYHRTLKKKKDFSTPLENISGIGKKTVNAVLKHFGSMKKASIASIEEFADVPLITKRRAEIIYKFFHND